jgi:hypothetical protein
MAVVVAVAGVTTTGADNNQQKAIACAAKMADVLAGGAEVALAATATGARREGEETKGRDWGSHPICRTSLGFQVYNLATIWSKKSNVSSECISAPIQMFGT